MDLSCLERVEQFRKCQSCEEIALLSVGCSPRLFHALYRAWKIGVLINDYRLCYQEIVGVARNVV